MAAAFLSLGLNPEKQLLQDAENNPENPWATFVSCEKSAVHTDLITQRANLILSQPWCYQNVVGEMRLANVNTRQFCLHIALQFNNPPIPQAMKEEMQSLGWIKPEQLVMEKIKTPSIKVPSTSEVEKQNRLKLIGILLHYLLTNVRPAQQEDLINTILREYPGQQGLSDSSLQKIFAEANKAKENV